MMVLGQHLKPASPQLSPHLAVSLPVQPTPGPLSLESPFWLGPPGLAPAEAKQQRSFQCRPQPVMLTPASTSLRAPQRQ